MVRPSKKALQGIALLLAALAFAVYAADWLIDRLPAWDRSSAWRWFSGGWAAATIALVLYFLPHWIRGTVNKPDPDQDEEMQYYIRILPWAAGAFGVLSAGLGLATSSIAVGFLSLGSGGVTALLILGIALNTTKRGRAMLDRAQR